MVYPHSYRTEHSVTQTTSSMYGDYYERTQKPKISIDPPLLPILRFVDANRKNFIEDLAKAVAIRSVSSKLKYRRECIKMIHHVEGWLKKLNVKYECFDIGSQTLEGEEVKLPPVILGTLRNCTAKRTVCFYAHLDVSHPCKKEWDTSPWEVEEIDRKLYGAGVAYGKGPLLCIFHAIQAFKKQKIRIPVCIKFIIESMRTEDNQGLEDFLTTKKLDFLCDIDAVVVCESEWLGEKIPCITYGSVGIMHYNLSVEKVPDAPTEPKEDIVEIFKHISDDQENIFIEHFHDVVIQITPDEERMYQSLLDFNIEDVRDRLPKFKKQWDQQKLLMSFWRLPSIYVGDVEECTCEKKDATKVQRHFILKIVPKQVVDTVAIQTETHVNSIVKALKLKNKVECELMSATKPWLENFNYPSYVAARRATLQIYKDDPNLIRLDRDMKIVTMLNRLCEREILLLPLGRKGINAGESNENIPLKNYYEGTKLLAAFLLRFAEVPHFT